MASMDDILDALKLDEDLRPGPLMQFASTIGKEVVTPDAILEGFGTPKVPMAGAQGAYQEIGEQQLEVYADERADTRQSLKLAKIEGYHAGLGEALTVAEGVRDGILEIGLDIIKDWQKQRTVNPNALPVLTKNQVDLLAHARQAGERVEDRLIPTVEGGTVNALQINVGQMFAGLEQIELPE